MNADDLFNVSTLVNYVRRRFEQRPGSTYYVASTGGAIDIGLHSLVRNELDSGVPGMTAAVNRALEIEGISVRVLIGDAMPTMFNFRHQLKAGQIRCLQPEETIGWVTFETRGHHGTYTVVA